MNFHWYCEICENDTLHSQEKVYEKWMDGTIDDDDDLNQHEIICRFNGDAAYITTCLECGNQFEEL